MDGMKSSILLMIIILDITSPGKGISIMMTDPVTDMAIGVINMMVINGAIREETVRMAGRLSVVSPRELI